jgi:hypothetical protein
MDGCYEHRMKPLWDKCIESVNVKEVGTLDFKQRRLREKLRKERLHFCLFREIVLGKLSL